jgi:hypothetical protein
MCSKESSSKSGSEKIAEDNASDQCKQHPVVASNVKRRTKTSQKLQPCHSDPLSSSMNGVNSLEQTPKECNVNSSDSCTCGGDWRPLILVIPLRLGLSEINPVYMPALKVST